MTIQKISQVTNLGLEPALSICSIRQWYPVTLNSNFYATNPMSAKVIQVPCRAINVNVDLTDSAANRTLTYVAVSGETLSFIANTNGTQPLCCIGIVSIGSGFDSASLQWGI